MPQFILLPLAVGFILSYFFTPIGIWVAKRYNLMDDPKRHKHPAIIHKKPIPRAGGLPIYLAILIASIIFLPMDRLLASILFSGFLVVVVGLLDDKYDLSPYLRFYMNVVCASIVAIAGVWIPFITNPIGGILHFPTVPFSVSGFELLIPVGRILAIIWIVWMMNMLNWSKGVDGQMPGIAAVSAIIIGIASLRFETLDPMNVTAAKLSFIVAGAALGFLPFNFLGRVFPGYSATILGFTLGILSIISGVKLATAVLVMGVPMIDAIFTILRRIAAKRSPFRHDKGHLHHLLLEIGLGPRVIAVLYWIMSAILGLIALTLSSKGKLFAIMVVIILVSGIILYLKRMSKQHEIDSK